MRWATFDCYGTLIDWERGLMSAFSELWPGADPHRLLSLHHQIEPRVQAGSAASYRDVLSESLRLVAAQAGLSLDAGSRNALSESLPSWPAFAEVPAALERLRSDGWRLAILSNTDPDLLEASVSNIGVPVDDRITAAEAGSYKPARGHWNAFFERHPEAKGSHVHVAASLFHDIEPAGRLGLRAVWINRKAEQSTLPRDAELPDLSKLPDVLASLILDQ